jgi:hypothetical protein
MGLVVVGALMLRALARMPFEACFAIALVALLINGWLAVWEDTRPGGFNNSNNDESDS